MYTTKWSNISCLQPYLMELIADLALGTSYHEDGFGYLASRYFIAQNSNEPILFESDIKQIVSSMDEAPADLFCGIAICRIAENSIRYYNSIVPSELELRPTAEDVTFLEDIIISRLREMLTCYSNGRELETKDFRTKSGGVGFRWKNS